MPVGPSLAVTDLASDVTGRAFDRLVTAVHLDSRGRVWIGTFEGFFERGVQKPTPRPVRTDHLGAGALAGDVNTIIGHVAGDPATLSADAVSAMAQDGLGRPWVGTCGGGLDDVDSGTGSIRHHRARAGDHAALCGNYVWDLASARRGARWLATSGGLVRFDAATDLSETARAAGPGAVYYSVVVDEAGVAWTPSAPAPRRWLPGGRLYLASEDGNVFVVRAGTEFSRLATNTMGEIVMATLATSGDLLVVRTQRHLVGLTARRWQALAIASAQRGSARVPSLAKVVPDSVRATGTSRPPLQRPR